MKAQNVETIEVQIKLQIVLTFFIDIIPLQRSGYGRDVKHFSAIVWFSAEHFMDTAHSKCGGIHKLGDWKIWKNDGMLSVRIC